jgi:hypothetical protein
MKIIDNQDLNYISSSTECARYIFDSDCEQISYQEFIQEGNNPVDHILYHAALVLGQSNEFQKDIDFYKERHKYV